MIKNLLFDLDGSLLPMDQDLFLKAYFKGLVGAMLPHGYTPEELTGALWAGIGAMIKNDGSCTNEQAFWRVFKGMLGERVDEHRCAVDRFYAEEFGKISAVCGRDDRAGEVVALLRERGVRVILATNPLFPKTATLQRIGWAGLDPDSFELITTYENSRFCKPNPEYYREIVNKLGLEPTECMMVGNDVEEDMIANTLGMDTFLLTPCMINKHNTDVSQYKRGDLGAFSEFIAAKV
ncbi:MAG: HAD family hydrolase [Clostridia bacterium]|nr:HAD family hydrolase [Clostridia bacterium]